MSLVLRRAGRPPLSGGLDVEEHDGKLVPIDVLWDDADGTMEILRIGP
jgi:hypothetical protein